jgi:hypothetical protein
MLNQCEKHFGAKSFVPCAAGCQLLKPSSLAMGRAVAQKVLLSSRRLETGLVFSNPHCNGFKRNMANINAFKCHEVFERKTSGSETHQPNLITKGRNQRQINE